MGPHLDRMKAPGDVRPGIWRGGVLQVKITNACSLDCRNCSVGVGQAKKLKKVFFMPPAQFREALRSLKGYFGVIGMFGGCPTLHPNFEEMCSVFREEIPNKEQRGLWANDLFGTGAVCRETFHGPHSNLNVHQDRRAWDEIRATWPEAMPIPAGLHEKSMHGPIFGSMTDVGIPEAEMWERVSKCYVNQTWSAEITVVNGKLAAYFCEIAATMAELTGDWSWGMRVFPGWWKQPMTYFSHQVNHYCRKCLVPLNGHKIDAAGDGAEVFTEAWEPVMLQVRGRSVRKALSIEDVGMNESPATKYLSTGVMRKGE